MATLAAALDRLVSAIHQNGDMTKEIQTALDKIVDESWNNIARFIAKTFQDDHPHGREYRQIFTIKDRNLGDVIDQLREALQRNHDLTKEINENLNDIDDSLNWCAPEAVSNFWEKVGTLLATNFTESNPNTPEYKRIFIGQDV